MSDVGVSLSQKSIRDSLVTINKDMGGIGSQIAGAGIPTDLSSCSNADACDVFNGYVSGDSNLALPSATGVIVTNASGTNPFTVTSFPTIKSSTGVIDINCLPLFTTSSDPQNYLKGLYAWHDLLGSDKWRSFVQGVTTTINIKTSAAATTATITLNVDSLESTGAVAITCLGYVVDLYSKLPQIIKAHNDGTLNIYLLRRMVYIHIILRNYKVAMSFYQSKFTDAAATATVPNARALVEAVYLLLAQANYNATNSDGGFAALSNRFSKRTSTYTQGVHDIDRTSDSLDDSRLYLTEKKNIFNSNVSTEARMKTISTVMTVLFVIIALTGCVVMFSGFESNKQLAIGGMMIIVSLVIMFIINYVMNGVVIEGFAAAPFSSFGSFGAAQSQWTDIVQASNKAMLDQTRKFLENSLVIDRTLTSYRVLGNVNNSMQKEQGFFGATLGVTDNQGSKYKEVANLTYLNSTEYVYRVHLLVSLAIILSVTVTMYVGLDSPKILWIGALVSAGAFAIYVMEVNHRVHTNTKQMYWDVPGDPDAYAHP